MKHKITLQLLLALSAFLLSVQVNAQNSPSAENEIKLNQAVAYSTKVVQVSFDGNDGDTGLFQIIDAAGVVVRQIDTVELIKSPSYFSVDVSELQAGDYTFLIKTKTKTYTSTISIK